MDHVGVNWWNSNRKQSPQSSFRNIAFEVEPPKELCHDKKRLGLQLSDDSSPTQSFGQSHFEVGATGVHKSHDKCIDDSSTKSLESRMKPVVLLSNPDPVSNPLKVDYGHSVDLVSYHHADPCFGGMFAAYGPQTIAPVGSQAVGILPARVPLPLDEDGPIYVNAKQYHGILRRRQLRAKLEAQNKLVKNRKPYLHESRHLHALNRVRGSGGRFLSTKKFQKSDSASATSSQGASNSIQLHLEKGNVTNIGTHQPRNGEFLTAPCLDIRSVSHRDGTFQQPEQGFSSISSHSGGVMQCSGRLLRRGTQSCASVVQ